MSLKIIQRVSLVKLSVLQNTLQRRS